jgi:predicted nucleic acid-binding protein
VIRAVYDANVLVAGFPASSGTMAALIDCWRSGEVELVTSQHIIDEVGRAWSKPYWRARSPRRLSIAHWHSWWRSLK